jgi:dTDP-glucose 4,6-dehydratase
MRFLVTGGAGFIGSNFVRELLASGHAEKIIVLDALTYAGNLQNLAGLEKEIEFVHGKIQDEALVRALLEKDVTHLVHFAAESHVDRSIHAPDTFIDTNVLGTHSLLKAANAVWKDRSGKIFLHVSTDEVFGSLAPHEPAFHEKTPYAPNSPYAASKAASDHLVRAYHHTYGLPMIISNCSNNYGSYQFPEKLIPLMLVNILEGKKLPLYGDGKQIRDWLHVSDHCRALLKILESGKLGETYAIGGRNEVANIDIVDRLCAIVDALFQEDTLLKSRFPNSPAASGKSSASLKQFVEDRLGHDRRYAINASKIEKELGFLPQENLKSGLEKTVQWYLANESWWRNVLSGTYRQWLELNYKNRQ